jgi:adenosine deaminase
MKGMESLINFARVIRRRIYPYVITLDPNYATLLFHQAQRNKLALDKDTTRETADLLNSIINKNDGEIHLKGLLRESQALLESGQYPTPLQTEILDDIKAVNQLLEKGWSSHNPAFPFESAFFGALVNIARSWEKQDVHCHRSTSLEVDFVYEMFKSKDAAQQKVIMETAREEFNVLPSAWSSPESLFPWLTSFTRVEKFVVKVTTRDLPMTDLSDFEKTIAHVAEQIFEDGVTNFEFRFNPLKSFGSVEDIIRAAHQELCKAEEAANKMFGRLHQTNIIACFNRAKCPPDIVEDTIRDLARLKARGADFSGRLYGIDLAGPKEILNPGYANAFELARQEGFLRTTHIGDSIYDRIEDGIKNVHTTLTTLTSVNRLGHALAIRPVSPEMEGRKDLLGERYTRERLRRINDQLQQVWDIIREREIIIETCPSVNTRSPYIKDYQEHPFHFWLDNDFKLALGIDGLWYWPSTLSEEVPKLLFSSPSNLTIAQIRSLVSPNP